MNKEKWKEVENFESARTFYKVKEGCIYLVSSHGRLGKVMADNVFSKDRLVNQITGYPSESGHIQVALTSAARSNRTRTGLHRVVAEAFVGSWPGDGWEVNHKDGNPMNNYYENLEWVSHAENIKHGFQELNRYRASSEGGFYRSFKSDTQITTIRKWAKKGVDIKDLALLAGVSQAAVRSVLKKKKVSSADYTKSSPKDVLTPLGSRGIKVGNKKYFLESVEL